MSAQHRKEKRRNVARRRRGATVVEFAVVAPVIFLIIFGLIEFSRMVMMQQSVTEAAQLGCRKATLATTNDVAKVDTAVRDYMASVILNPSTVNSVQVTITPISLTNLAPGTPISVQVQVNFADVSWLPGNLLGMAGTEVLTSTSILERE